MRIAFIGTSGSGKTTFARTLADRLATVHIELDALYWLPNWTGRPKGEFRDCVNHAVAAPEWVCEGNYSSVRDVVWGRAEFIIWLDFTFPRVFSRALSRTMRRLFTGEELFGGNREQASLIFTPDWIPWWVIRTYRRRRREYRVLLEETRYRHLRVFVFRRPRDANAFLEDARSIILSPDPDESRVSEDG